MGDFKYSLITAISKTNDVIGLDNELAWRASMDLKYFKRITNNNVVIMGRKTYDSIGKPLPNRINIVITRNPKNLPIDFSGSIASSLEEALKMAASYKDKETIVIGGSQIYLEALKSVTKMYITWVSRKDKTEIVGNKFFPTINLKEFRLVDEFLYKADPVYDLDFNTFIRK